MPFNKFHVSLNDVKSPDQLQRTLNTVQKNVEDVVNSIEKLTLLNKAIVSNIVVNTSATIEHKLGRVPNGYFVIAKNANANIWNGALTDTQLTLNSSAAVTITIYIF